MTDVAYKICLIGDIGVGKTSLVARYVRQTFSERYLTTVGVKIDSREITSDTGRRIKLVIWDLAGGGDMPSKTKAYIRGMSGALVVADGTRLPTLRTARLMINELCGPGNAVPWLGLANKSDLTTRWELEDSDLEHAGEDWRVVSALSGDGVERAFEELAQMIEDRR